MNQNRRNFLIVVASFLTTAASSIQSSFGQKYRSKLARKRTLPFLLGWYDSIQYADTPAKLGAKNIDLVMPYVGEAKPEMLKSFLDNARAARVKVLLEVYRSLIESKNLAGVKEFVNTYKNHPAVYGWYLYDEPEIAKPAPLKPELLTAVYRAIKEADKSKPVAIAFGETNKIEPYANAMDILMWDNYPCEDGVAEFQWIANYRDPLRKVAGLAQTKQKKFWSILQAYRGHGFKKRLPSKAEFRYMFYSSILAGSDALLFWMHSWSTPSWNESVLYPTLREFRRYTPAIVSGRATNIRSRENSDFEIELFAIPKSRKKLIVAVNHHQHKVISNIKLDRQLANRQVKVNNQNIARISDRANFKVELNPFEVKLYEVI